MYATLSAVSKSVGGLVAVGSAVLEYDAPYKAREKMSEGANLQRRRKAPHLRQSSQRKSLSCDMKTTRGDGKVVLRAH